MKLKVTLRDFHLSEATQAESDSWHQARRAERQASVPQLQSCLTVTNLIDFAELKSLPDTSLTPFIGAMGSKAAQTLQMLRSGIPHSMDYVDTTNLDHCLAIPFYHYKKHVKSSCGSEIESFIKEERAAGGLSAQDVRAALGTIRFLIEDAPLPPKCTRMIEILSNTLSAWRQSPLAQRSSGVILRSSTNVEDIEGFNGAGLYESLFISWEDAMDPGRLCATVRSVWASLWNFRGYQERSVFGMNQEEVFMGILVQPFFGKDQGMWLREFPRCRLTRYFHM